MSRLALLNGLVHVLLLVALPPLMVGSINRVKSWAGGRQGPPILQLVRDVAKLWRKGSVLSATTSPVFLLGPVVGLVTTVFAALLVPLGNHPALVSFPGDLFLFAYLLALGRFFTVAAALDTGSAFEGMGSAREATFACLAEPALFLGLVCLVRTTGGALSLSALLTDSNLHWAVGGGALLLVLAAWMIVLLVENSRVPFDDPNTHLELTMIHEVMVLDHGGPPLAVILTGAAVKLFLFGALLVGLVLPPTGNQLADWAAFVTAMVLLAGVIGGIESGMARLQLLKVRQLLIAANLLAAFAVALLLR